MKFLRELFHKKDTKLTTNLIILFVVGIILLLFSNGIFPAISPVPDQPVSPAEPSQPGTSYETTLEQRLEQALGEVAGVGKVKVMITISYGREIILATDRLNDSSRTMEEDAQGGKREMINESLDEKTLMVAGSDGAEKPYVLKEIEPVVAGIIIVAEGGGDVHIKRALTDAAITILGVGANRVQVFQMKTTQS